jgi:drug/metabolite transporter (DMT)-like permease
MKILDIIQLLLLAALWGGSFLFMRIASPVLGPVWLIEFRVLLAGLALLPFLVRSGFVSKLRRYWFPLIILGCFNSAMPFLLFAFGALFLPAGFSSILNATVPLFGTVVAFVCLKEKLTLSQAIGLGLGFAGVVVLVGWRTFVPTPSFVTAVGAGLIGALMYAIGAFYAKRKLAEVPSLAIATGSLLSAAVFLLPAMPFTVPNVKLTPVVAIAVLALALFSTALAYILYFQLIKNVGSTKALTVAYLIPIFAMLWGTIFLQESITRSMVLGCSLILIGTAIANNLFAAILNIRFEK